MAGLWPRPHARQRHGGVDSFQRDRAQRIVAEGEAHLQARLESHAGRHPPPHRRPPADEDLRVAMFAATARDLFARVETPDDIAAARRYLGVYLQAGARDAPRDAGGKFADLLCADARYPRNGRLRKPAERP